MLNKDDTAKQKACSDYLVELEEKATIVISTQVVKEVSAVLLRKFNYPIPELKALISFLEKFEVVETPVSSIRSGIDIMESHQLSFWDSLICAAAASANCSAIVTEDMNHGQEILGMKIQSPFR